MNGMKRTMNRLCAGLLVIMVCAFAAGCSAAPLPDGFDADEVTARAEEIIGYANAGDYDTIIDNLREDLRDAVTADQLSEGWAPTYERVGAFENIKKVVLSGTTDNTTGEEYAVVQALCVHEDGNVLYTLSFDQDLQLVGLYLK